MHSFSHNNTLTKDINFQSLMSKLIPRRRSSNRFKYVHKSSSCHNCIVFSFQVDLHTTTDCRVTYKGISMRTGQGEVTVKTLGSASIR